MSFSCTVPHSLHKDVSIMIICSSYIAVSPVKPEVLYKGGQYHFINTLLRLGLTAKAGASFMAP